MRYRRTTRTALLATAIGLLAVAPATAGGVPDSLQGVYRGEGIHEEPGRELGLIKFRVTNEDKVEDVVLEDLKVRCDGVVYTLSKTTFVNDPRIKGDWPGHFSFEKTFYNGTQKELNFKVRGEFKRPEEPRAVGIVRVGGRGVGSPGDWCGPAQEWKAWHV